MTSFFCRRRIGLACQTSHPDSGAALAHLSPTRTNALDLRRWSTRGWALPKPFNATPTSKAEYTSLESISSSGPLT